MKKCHEGKMRYSLTVASLTIAILLSLTVSSSAVQWPKDMTLVSPAPGAAAHMVLIGMGNVVAKHTPIENCIVQPLGGPKVWLPLMKAGKCDLANHSAPDILNAFLGRGSYESMGPQDVRTVVTGHDYMFMFWTTPGKNIKTVADLKGKIAHVKLKGNPMFIEMGENQLGSVGLKLEDMKKVFAFSSIKDAISDLIEGRVDAVLYPVVPGPVMEINEAKGECLFVNLSKKQAQYVIERMEGYYISDIPANDPRFRNKSAVPNAVCYQQAMFTPAKTDPEIIYAVTKAIYDHSDEFADSHPSAPYWSLKHRPVSLAVPYHEGTIKYLKEKGLWTVEAQAYQEKLLERQKKIKENKK